jgi:hypothetical protein
MHGADGCRVTVVTDRSEISRTLTRKGNGTIKLTREGVASSMTQSQLETMLGSVDLFLAAFIPGFFLRLSTERQHKVISEIRPKVDRLALLQSIVGFALLPEEAVRFPLDKRADLVASQVAQDRRELDKSIAMTLGQIKELQALQPLAMPVAGNEPSYIARQELLRQQGASYRTHMMQHSDVAARTGRVRTENESKARRRQEILVELGQLANMPMALSPPMPPSPVEDLAKLTAQLISTPSRPQMHSTVEADHCPTCGQAVSLKHRERVRDQNCAIEEEYRKELERVESRNALISDEVKKLQSSYNTCMAVYRTGTKAASDEVLRTGNMKRKLEIEMASLVYAEVPAAQPMPEMPEEEFDECGLIVARASLESFKKAQAQYQYVTDQIAKAQLTVATLTTHVERSQAAATRLEAIERGLKQLPTEEMKLQAGIFEMGRIRVAIDRDISVFVDDIPYGMLSTGQAMKTDVAISRRISSLMARPIGMLFLDNADLVDEYLDSDIQTFVAEVAMTDLEVK